MTVRRSFRREQTGTTMVLWALMVLPVLMLVAGALDFSSRNSAESVIQSAADAAAIAAVRHAVLHSDNETGVISAAESNFLENLASTGYHNKVTPVVTVVAGDYVEVSANYAKPTAMLGVMGIATLNIDVQSRAAYRTPANIEAVLVLDNSTSMEGQRMDDLKIAATAFVDQVVNDGNDNVRVAIVPFTNYVNVGTSNKYASWLDVPSDSVETSEVCTVDEPASMSAGCTIEPSTCETDGIDYDCQVWVCPSGVNLVSSCTTTSLTLTWYGCVNSRTPPLDVEDRSYATIRVPAYMNHSDWGCNTPILPLTSNVSDLHDTIDSMVAEGATYIATGLAWGRRALSSQKPFDEGVNDATFAAAGHRKILILMSDGANAKNRDSSGAHWGTDLVAANATTIAACDELKTAGVEVYTIAFDVSDADTLDLLEDCASMPAQFFDASNAAAISDAFKSIGADFKDVALVR